MRLSTNQIFQSGLSAMQRAQSNLNYTNLQMATGRRILTPSDDPSGATVSVQLEAKINATEQYQRNIDLAQPRLEQEEAQLDAYENYLNRVRELVVLGSNDTYNKTDRVTLASEIRQLRDDILALANTKDSNGEYLFGGTGSLEQPFTEDGDGLVSYIGADGVGAVRDVFVSLTRSIQVGDTGKSIFMDVSESSGKLVEALPVDANTGTLVVEKTQVIDSEKYSARASETFNVRFIDNAGTMEYAVYDTATPPVQLTDESGNPIQGTFDPDVPIEFAGRSLELSGTPKDGDVVISRPARYVSIFQTLDSIATAFENYQADTAGKDVLSESVVIAFKNIDSSLNRMNEVRTSVGMRLGALDTHSDLNDQHQLNMESTLSDIRDLDYAEAISRYQLEQVVLEAAQKTYTQVSKMSLFDFM